jgi:hypothetical protein
MIYDAKTKIAPVMQLESPTQEMAYSVAHELKSRLQAGCIPIFSSDGLKHYYCVLTAHFGEWIVCDGEKKPVWLVLSKFFYVQVIKHQRMFRLVEVEERQIWGLTEENRRILKAGGLSGNINTSFVERVKSPGTARQGKCDDTTECFKIDMAQMGNNPVRDGAIGTSVLVVGRFVYHFSRNHEGLRVRRKSG